MEQTRKRKRVTPKEQLKKLLDKERQYTAEIESIKIRLIDLREKIEVAKKDALVEDFANMPPDVFLRVSEILESQNVPLYEILKLFASGKFEDMATLHASLQDALGQEPQRKGDAHEKQNTMEVLQNI